MLTKFVWMRAMLLVLGLTSTVLAQSNTYRGSQAYIGISPGIYGYHGRVSLNNTAVTNTTSQWLQPGGAIYASFPVKENVWYFRGVLGAANFNPDLSTFTYKDNVFGSKPVVWIESQAVVPIMRGAKRVLPYVFLGFGGLIADPAEGFKNETEVPGVGDNKPDRTAFSFPVAGAGVDFAINKRLSVFGEGTYRYHWNFLVKSPNHPFSTTFFAVGLRYGLKPKAIEGGGTDLTPPPIPDPKTIPMYEPPGPTPEPPKVGCQLADLNSVYFNYNSDELDAAAKSLLDENIAELMNNPDCCVKILGYTDEASSAAKAMQIAQARAQRVFDYYVSKGISASRLRLMAMGIAQPNCNKSDPGKGCRFNRRVESKPVDCTKIDQ